MLLEPPPKDVEVAIAATDTASDVVFDDNDEASVAAKTARVAVTAPADDKSAQQHMCVLTRAMTALASFYIGNRKNFR